MNDVEYLVSYGLQAEFGRFRAAGPFPCRRGDRVVVRTPRGLEIGQVLRLASPRHARFLPNTTVGPLLRRLREEDQQAEITLARRGGELLDRAGRLAEELDLPLELLDVEVLLEGQYGVLHLLRSGEIDLRPFVSTLSREFQIQISLVDLSQPVVPEEEEEHHGCGSAGGCGSCGSGGGCGSCGTTGTAHDVRDYFATLRSRMERERVNLL